jgi:hypothetical protein
MTKKPQHGLLQEYSQRAQEALKIKIKFLYDCSFKQYSTKQKHSLERKKKGKILLQPYHK